MVILTLVRWAMLPIGIAILLLTWGSLLHTVTGPRGRTARLARYLGRFVEFVTVQVARRMHGERRERMLSLTGPVAFLVVLAGWLVGFVIGYSLIISSLVGQGPGAAFTNAARATFLVGLDANVSILTTFVSFAAAMNGLVVVTLELAYLPSLYAAYNRREVLAALVARRCQGRLTGVELLCRHFEIGAGDRLGPLYGEWEHWVADLTETHTNYPILTTFRSPEPNEHWLIAFLTMLDAAALHAVVSPMTCPPEAALLIEAGTVCLNRIARARRDARFPTGQEERDDAMVERAFHRLRATSTPLVEDVRPMLRRFHLARAHYLPLVRALAGRLYVNVEAAAPRQEAAVYERD